MRWSWPAAGLLVVLAGQLVVGVVSDGMVFDEVAYIPAGNRHLSASDYRLNPETPPLAKLVSALPLLALSLKGEPPTSSDASWKWSFQFLHVDNESVPVPSLARLPNVLLTLALAGSGLALWRQRPSLKGDGVEIHWLVSAAITFLAASLGRKQIGERYILAIYHYLIMLIASRMPGMLRRSRDRWLLGTLFAFHAFPTLAALPRGHRAYFNILAEGLGGADRVLLDSNLDWGQDLPRLAAWMRRRGVKHVQLGYFGSDRPGRYRFFVYRFADAGPDHQTPGPTLPVPD